MNRCVLGAGVQCVVLAMAGAACEADTWPGKHRDGGNTGRSDFVVPLNRQGANFFDIYRWQTPLPGSPGEGSLGASAVSFFDGVGPKGEDVAVVGYHWPKGVIGLDRHTGRVLWFGNPSGGETIGESTPAFSTNGATVYVANDATESKEFPGGHPCMGFATAVGPGTFWHNGGDAEAWQLAIHSPKVGADGRVYLHSWVDRPRAAADSGTALSLVWNAATNADQGLGDVALYAGPSGARVIVGSRSGAVKCYDGASGAEVWSAACPTVDATPTVDPATGNVFVAAGSESVAVVGLTRDGAALWGGSSARAVFTYAPGKNTAQRAQSAGCLSHDGGTYYFQTNSQEGDGALYAVNTANGTVKWTYATGSLGWEVISSSPIVTANGIVVVGNNYGGAYFALRDDGTHATLLDTLVVSKGGEARSTATLAADGTLYLPVRAVWTTPSEGEPSPTLAPANVVTAVDLRADAQAVLAPPGRLRARVLNGAVELKWVAVPDPSGALDHYAVYRGTGPFSSVEGMTPIAEVMDPGASGYVDGTAVNGVSYWYGVTSVSTTGGEAQAVGAVGPRTPFDETDLQVASVSRTPRFPRYDPSYSVYEVTEPGGFGPYFFSVATGLGSGQTEETQRWPSEGSLVTYAATVRNRGTNAWAGPTLVRWRVNGELVLEQTLVGAIAPGGTVAASYQRAWDEDAHDRIEFEIVANDARAGNNTFELTTKSVAFLSYVDETYLEEFRELTATDYPDADTDDLVDWLNRHMARFNEMFEDAGTGKRVHFDVLTVLDDLEADPVSPPAIEFAIFPFRYRAGDGTIRLSGYYDPGEDLDFGLLHEMGHQLGLIDLYRLNLAPEQNFVNATGYSTGPCLMNGVSHFVSQGSAAAMTRWLETAHGYYGQYLYQLPDQVRLRVLGFDGGPLSGATVRVYQKCEREGLGEVIAGQVKFELMTDGQGYCTLPNVELDPELVPSSFAGDVLRDNPFGYVAVVGSNGVFLIEVEVNGFRDYAWLDIVEVNNAFTSGETGTATFSRQVSLGGPVQVYPPSDMAEINAGSWGRWSQDGSIALSDDFVRRRYRAASVKIETTGGFDNLVRYPADRQALWDVSDSGALRAWFYAENPNGGGFQGGSPWLRLLGRDGYIELHPNSDVLNTAIGQWREFAIPLAGNGVWQRSQQGEVSLEEIVGVEIHADTWGAGFTLWIDGVRFDPTPCPADWNGDGVSNSTDVSDFINDWFADQVNGTLATDWDNNGVSNSTDVSAFINAWFADNAEGCG